MLKHMQIAVDAHTHTVMSGHAWSTITENCRAAAEKGLSAICMTTTRTMIAMYMIR